MLRTSRARQCGMGVVQVWHDSAPGEGLSTHVGKAGAARIPGLLRRTAWSVGPPTRSLAKAPPQPDCGVSPCLLYTSPSPRD
eukprot:15433600-Alexandrium_andersonii.AAC.1